MKPKQRILSLSPYRPGLLRKALEKARLLVPALPPTQIPHLGLALAAAPPLKSLLTSTS